MVHSRRRFVDALKASKKGDGPPEQALRFFEQFYRVERQARDKELEDGETQADGIRRFRQQHSVPILNALKSWLDDIEPKVPPDSKLGDAVSYTLNQWEYLTRWSQGQHRRLQRDAALPGRWHRAVSLVAPRSHRVASAHRSR